MSGVVERLLRLPPQELKVISCKRPKVRRGRYRRRGRTERTKDQLAEYLRSKGFKSRRQLRKGRDEGDPTDDDYVSVWGSWGEAVNDIWKVEPFNREFVAKSLIEWNLWTKRGYQTSRLKMPDILPSLFAIDREFGSWGVLKNLARAMSLGKTLEDYIKLKRELGRRPTWRDCDDAGIVLDKALEIYRTKWAFDQFVDDLERVS